MSANLGTSAVRLYTLSLDFAEPCIMLHANAVCIKAGARLCKAFLFSVCLTSTGQGKTC